MASGHTALVRAIIAIASLSLLLLGACSQPRVGVDVGIVYQGGPAPGHSNALRPGTIMIFMPDGTLKTSGRVQDGHSFHADLPQGSYQVEAHSGDAGCVSRSITVRNGSNATLHVVCSIR